MDNNWLQRRPDIPYQNYISEKKCSFIILFICWIILCLIQPDDAHAWGALAVAKNHSDAWGVASGHSTSNEAGRVAISKCGNDCKLVRLFVNECVAYVVDKTSGSSIIGESWGCATRDYAETRALDQCRTRGGTDCVVRAWGCDTWNQKAEEQKTTTKSRKPINYAFDSAYGRYSYSIVFKVITARIDYEPNWFEIRKINMDRIDSDTMNCYRGDTYGIYAKTKVPYEYIIYGQGQVVKKEDHEVNLKFNDEQAMTDVCNILKGN